MSAVSRGRYDAQIYTNDATKLGDELNREVSHASALDWNGKVAAEHAGAGKDHGDANSDSYGHAIAAVPASTVHAARDHGMER